MMIKPTREEFAAALKRLGAGEALETLQQHRGLYIWGPAAQLRMLETEARARGLTTRYESRPRTGSADEGADRGRLGIFGFRRIWRRRLARAGSTDPLTAEGHTAAVAALKLEGCLEAMTAAAREALEAASLAGASEGEALAAALERLVGAGREALAAAQAGAEHRALAALPVGEPQ